MPGPGGSGHLCVWGGRGEPTVEEVRTATAVAREKAPFAEKLAAYAAIARGRLDADRFAEFKATHLAVVILVSWLIALPEYALQVPANRWGHGTWTAAQLKGSLSVEECTLPPEIVAALDDVSAAS